MTEWPKLGSVEDANATHRWARECLEMWERERGDLLAERDRYKALAEAAETARREAERLRDAERMDWVLATQSATEGPQRG